MDAGINSTRDVDDRPWVGAVLRGHVKKETVLNTLFYLFRRMHLWVSFGDLIILVGEVVRIRTGKRDLDAV